MSAILEVADLSVSFGGVHAVRHLGLEVCRGEIVGLIGPNGAGKTTTIDAICGFVASTGTVRVSGRDVTRMRPHVRARSGISRTFQSLELFEDMTLAENLGVAVESLPRERRQGAAHEDARAALKRVGLDVSPDVLPATLSHGDRKLLAVARALVGAPALLLLDEPAAGLNSAESEILGDRLRQLRETGASILLVDHDMGLVASTCDQVYVLDFGRQIARGAPQTIMRDPKVIAAYLGAGEGEVRAS